MRFERSFFSFVVMSACLWLSACSGGNSSGGGATNNPVPAISSIAPSSIAAGSGAQSLAVSGTGFTSSATATFNGAARSVSFTSSTNVAVALNATDVATAGTYAVVVSNPSPGGGASNSVNLTVNNVAPTVTSISPATIAAGSAATTLTVTGTGFSAATAVTLAGASVTPIIVSATSLTVPLTAANLASPGTLALVVTNPAPGGGSSTAVNLSVTYPVPTVTSISPSVIPVGSAATTLTVTGTGFSSKTTVTLGGAAVTPTVGSATSLTVPLTAANLASPASLAVVVTNPTPGGGSSPSAVSLSVVNPAPTVTSISPSTLVAGAPATTVTVTGTGFNTSTTVTLAGAAVTPTILSATSLTISIAASSLATPASLAIVVSNPTPGGGSSTTTNFAVTGPIIAGQVYKGPSVGSTVTAYNVNANGTNGAAIGSAVTDSNGAFTLTLTALPAGAVRFTASGGNYVSEYDASTITGTSNVSALMDTVTKSASGLSITPATEFVNSYAAALLASGALTSEVTAHAKAEALIDAYIGVPNTTVLESLVPVFDKPSITSNPTGFTLGLFIGALATEGNTAVPTSPDNLIAALSADISDGVFDGKASGVAVALPSAIMSTIRMAAVPLASSTGLSVTAGTTDMLLALGKYITSGYAITSRGIMPSDVSSLESSFFTGVSTCTCTPASSGLAASSSGAATSYSLAGRQYLIVAARQQGVVVVDVTDPTLAAPPINAWPSISSGTFGGNDVGGVIAITGLTGHPQVLAYAYSSKTIAVLNLNTLITGNPATDNPVDVSTSLTLKGSIVGFSGGSAYIAGGIPDTGRLGIWLDTTDGYGLLPLSALTTASTTSPVALTNLLTINSASSQSIAENLGGDILNNQLLGGNYGGINLMELGKAKSYYMPASTLAKTATYFSGLSVDGNSMDSALRVGILTSEDTPAAVFLNLNTTTETDATGTAANTLTAATGGLVQVVLGTSGGYGGYGPILSGSAVDKYSHLALFMAGYSNDFAVGQLQDPSSVASGAAWTGMTDWSYFTINSAKNLSGYSYATDPHSVVVLVNQTTGTPYGYLFDGSTDKGIVQIDMKNFLALARKGTTGDLAHQPGVDPSTATATVGTKTGVVLQEFTWSNPTKPISTAARQKVTQEEYPNQPVITPVPQQ